MSEWRADVIDAVGRMRITFGARAAARNLPDCLDPGEQVRELVACTYAGGDGLLALTDRRVLAVRDDYARYRVQAVELSEAYAVDYAPRVHDGLGVLTPSGRVAVRKMNREDSDRFVAALTAAHPHIVVGASRPKRSTGPRPPAAAQAAASKSASITAPFAAASPASVVEASSSAGLPAATPPTPAPVAAPVDPVAAAAQDDSATLLGVLADLHAKGLLSSDELAAKIALVTARP